MPPKKQILQKIEDNESMEPFISETLEKLVIADLYAPWTGPCEMMKEYYKTLIAKYDDFLERCAILQVKQGKVSFFQHYGNEIIILSGLFWIFY